MNIDIESLIGNLKTGIIGIAKTSFGKYLPQAEADATAIANAIKANIQTWTAQLTSGAINADDLKFLISGNEELLKIDALTQAGIAQIQLDQFKADVTNLIVKTVTAAI
jgi:hypothetical protein